MNENAPTHRPPTAEQCRAIVLSLLVVLSIVAATAVVPVPVAAASDDAMVTLGNSDPGVMTTHNWSITADGASGESLSQLTLDYFGTGTNLSAVDATDIEVTVDGTPVDVDFVPDNGDDESLPIVLSNSPTVNSGDVVAVNFLNDSVENPSEEATHSGMVSLYDSEGVQITSGSDSFVISSVGVGTLDGQVTSAADGTGIESATIDVIDGETLVASTTTAPDGNYSVDVPAGTYDVSVSHPSYDTATMSGVSVGDGETMTVDVTLTEGGGMEADPASVTLGSTAPGAMTTHNWSITANGASGETMERIQLYYTDSGANFSAVGVDDLDITVAGTAVGAGSLEDVGDENLSVVLSNPVTVNGGDEVTVEFLDDVVENPTMKSSYYPSIGLLGSQEVGGISSGFDEIVIGAGTLDGRVTNSSDGTGIGGAQVQAIDGGGTGTSTVTNATGYYDISVAEGTYDVSVSHPEYDSNTTSGVSVVSGETTTVDVSLSSAAFSVVDASVEHVSGTVPTTMPTVRTYETNLAGISLINESDGQDLASLGVASDTVLRVNATIQGMTPRQLIGTIHDASWAVTDVDGDRVNVTVVGKPASAQYMLDAPSLDNWPDDGTDQADMKYEQMWDVALDDMEYGGLSAAELEQVNGSILATDAQTFSMPSYDEGPEGEAGTLSIEIGGPHLTVDGTTNHGYFEGFIPDAQLDAWNVTNPETELVANYAGAGVNGMSVTSVDGGAEFAFPVHYSAGEVSMTAGSSSSDPANFDVEIENTNAPVVEGADLSVDVNVTNTGGEMGTKEVSLGDFDMNVVDNRSVTLAGGENKTITLTWETQNEDNGTGDIIVGTADGSTTKTVTIEKRASFDVTIAETNAPVVAGEALDVNVTVQNTGDVSGTQTITLASSGAATLDSKTVALDAGGTSNFNLTWTTGDGDAGDEQLTVASENDSATRTVTVEAPAFFDVSITGTDAPVTEGTTLSVDVTVENTGDVTGTQDVTLANFDGTVVDTATVSDLAGGGSESITLQWGTSPGDNATDDVTVASENDSVVETVTIQRPANFDVSIDDANAPVTEGDELTVDVTVENTGDVTATQDINLTDFDDTVVDTRSIQLAGGASQTVTLTWTTTNGDNATDAVSVTSDDDTATRTVTVNELVFDVTIDGTNAPVTEGDVLAVDVTVENKGDGTATQSINLTDFGGTVVDSNESVALASSETVSFTLEWDTDDGDAGSGSLSVTSDNGSASRVVTIESDSSGGPPLPPRSPELAIVELDASATTVGVGEPVSVDVLVENTGNADGEQDLELTVDGSVVDTAAVPIAADESATSTLSHAFDEAGSYELAVNGDPVGTVDVEAADEDPDSDEGESPDADDEAEATDGNETDTSGDTASGTDGSDDDSTPGFTPIAAILGLLYVVVRRTGPMTNRR